MEGDKKNRGIIRTLYHYNIHVLIILIIAFFTNPTNLQTHKDAVVEYYKEKYVGVSKNNSDMQNAMNSLQNLDKAFLGEFIEPLVSYKNYYLFSLTQFSDRTVGFGVLGKVFVFGNLTQGNTTASNNQSSAQTQQTNNGSPLNHGISIGSKAYGGIVSWIYDDSVVIVSPYDLGEMNWSEAFIACIQIGICQTQTNQSVY
jgi:hypothetical protein